MPRILLSVRREPPGMGAFVASGSPTPSDGPNSGVVWGGTPYSPVPICRGRLPRPTANNRAFWKSLWPPNASVLYRESRTGSASGGGVHVPECVPDFSGRTTSSRYSACGYSKSPESIARGAIKEATGEPTNTKTVEVYRAYF